MIDQLGLGPIFQQSAASNGTATATGGGPQPPAVTASSGASTAQQPPPPMKSGAFASSRATGSLVSVCSAAAMAPLLFRLTAQ